MIDTAAIKSRVEALTPFLGERHWRLWAASGAYAAGRGGTLAVAAVTGIARRTIGRGLAELGYGQDQFAGRIRACVAVAQPQPALVARTLARSLAERGFSASQ